MNDATKQLELHVDRLLKARQMLLESEKKSTLPSTQAGSHAASTRSIVPATGNRIAEAGAASTFGDANESDARVSARCIEIFRAAGVSTPEDDDAVAALEIEVRKGLDYLLTFLPEDARGEVTPPIVGIVDAVASGQIGRAHV